MPGWDIVYLKCGRRSRLLPIHLAQDGRQIELPPETQDQRALAAFLSFLPSFLRRARSVTSLPFLISSNLLLHLPSVLIFTLLLPDAVIGFFLYSVGQYNYPLAPSKILGFQAASMERGKKRKGTE